MCGIHGVAALNSELRYGPEHVRRMGDVTVHRGPDDSGVHVAERAIIAMRRLSIIDVDGGHQPISNADNTIWVVCNGEIYNFLELRKALESDGVQFKTHSDTEVVVHLYAKHGMDFVTHLRGMFGFAIWDARSDKLIVGRDRLGIKPIYYAQLDGNLAFASEAKSILSLPGVSREICKEALSEYLVLGYVPAPLSIFKSIRKLKPGHMLVIERGELQEKQYWRLQSDAQNHSDAEWQEKFQGALRNSVQSQMISDVPLGAFLSGGIDSSAVVACMAEHSQQPVKTFSIGFGGDSGGSYYNELPYARQVSDLFGTDHKEIIVNPKVVDLMPKLLWHMDEPIADTAYVTTYLVSQFAREEVTVILSGVGGDELFGGYRRYLGDYYLKAVNWMPVGMRRALLKHVLNRMPADRHSPLLNLSRYARALLESSEMDFETRYMAYVGVLADQEVSRLLVDGGTPTAGTLSRAFAQFPSGDAVNRMMQVDLVTQLPDDLLILTDKMSMAASLECRVPLLDEQLLELSMSMPGKQKIRGRELKSIMKRSLKGMLPKEILYRKKRGFGAPMGAWFKNELQSLLNHLLSPESVAARGLFNYSEIQRIVSEHASNRADRTDVIMSLVNFEIWARMYIDGRAQDDVLDELKRAA